MQLEHQRRRGRLWIGILVLCFCYIAGANPSSQSDTHYTYRGGDHYEGVRRVPVQDRFELLAVLLNSQEQLSQLPAHFKLNFYLSQRSQVNVRIREIDNRHGYWMDKIRPPDGWRTGFNNEFQWSTQDVIERLGDINLENLGAVAQLGSAKPSADMGVAPVALYATQRPLTVSNYSFTFILSRNADITYSVSQDISNAAIIETATYYKVPGHRPRTINWDPANAKDGWYRLALTTVNSDNGHEVKQVIHFYHKSGPLTLPPTTQRKPSRPASSQVDNSTDGSGVFPAPVRLTEPQKERFVQAAYNLRVRQDRLKLELTSVGDSGPFTKRKRLLSDALTNAKADIQQSREPLGARLVQINFAFETMASNSQAAEMFIGELISRYDAKLLDVSSLTEGQYIGFRDQCLDLLRVSSAAYERVAQGENLTFNLLVDSVPKGAQISFRRKGDGEFTINGSQTNASIEHLGYAVWFVRVTLLGFKEQEQQHDPFREENHVMTFDLQRSP